MKFQLPSSKGFVEKMILSLVVIAALVMGVWTWRRYIQPNLPTLTVPVNLEQVVPQGIRRFLTRTVEQTEIVPQPEPSAVEPPVTESTRVLFHAAGLRDPFVSALPLDQAPAAEANAAPVALPPMALQGIIWGEVAPQAIIDRKVVQAGDTVGGAEVVSIDHEGVMLL